MSDFREDQHPRSGSGEFTTKQHQEVDTDLDAGPDLEALAESLDKVMEFDHVVEITEDGTVVERDDLYAPSLYGEEIDEATDRSGWEFASAGYTGQDRYNGPIMHASEQMGGRLAADIAETPGIYVVVVANCDHEDCDADPEDVESGQADCEPDGWAVLRKSDEPKDEVQAPRDTMVRDSEHAVLDAAWNDAFADLKAAGLESDADDPIAARYREASNAVNHANRSRDFAIATGQSTADIEPDTRSEAVRLGEDLSRMRDENPSGSPIMDKFDDPDHGASSDYETAYGLVAYSTGAAHDFGDDEYEAAQDSLTALISTSSEMHREAARNDGRPVMDRLEAPEDPGPSDYLAAHRLAAYSAAAARASGDDETQAVLNALDALVVTSTEMKQKLAGDPQ